jgi:collagen type II alpha
MSAADVSAAQRVGVGTASGAATPGGMSRPGGMPSGQANFGPGPFASRSGTPGHALPPQSQQDSQQDSQQQAYQKQQWAQGQMQMQPPPQQQQRDWREEMRSPPGFAAHGSGASQQQQLHAQHASPPPGLEQQHQQPALAAPRAVPPYPRFQSPNPLEGDSARSPSPSKRNGAGNSTSGGPPNFVFGDARERWASVGQAQQHGSAGPPPGYFGQQGPPGPQGHAQQQQQPQPQHQSHGPPQLQQQRSDERRAQEPHGSYAELWASARQSADGPRGPPPSGPPPQRAHHASDPPQGPSRGMHELEHGSARFEGGPGAFARDDGPYASMTSNGLGRGAQDDASLMGFIHGGMPGVPASGSLSPRSLLHYHHQQVQAQQALAMQTAQQSSGLSGGSTLMSAGAPEEITTVFIVGFPDDMTEREFANMFLFAKGFEASTLKIPAGGPTVPGGPHRPENGALSGPGGPYNAVTMPGAGLFDLAGPGPPGGWDEHSLSLALSRAGAGDAFSSLSNLGGLSSALQGLGGPSNSMTPGGKIKQIIGFAKFRTRSEALEARDALNGRKIDAERGCVLKTEMAKKNLHTKQRPVLSQTNPILDSSGFPTSGGPPPPGPPPSSQFSGGMGGPPAPGSLHERELGFQRPPGGSSSSGTGGPSSAGPYGSFTGGPHASFDPFPGSSSGSSGGPAGPHSANGMLSPSHEGFGRPDFFGPPPTGPRGQMQAMPGARGGYGSDAGPPQSAEPARSGPPSGPSQQAPSDKWAPAMGPLDYFDGPNARYDSSQQQRGPPGMSQQGLQQPQGQQQQSRPGRSEQQPQQSTQGQSAQQLRGPDWSTLGSPPSMYGQARAAPLGFGPQARKGLSGSASPLGEHGGSGAPSSGSGDSLGARGQEDFGIGESTARVLHSTSPPRTGSETIRHGADESILSSLRQRTPQQQQPSQAAAQQGRAASGFPARFGALRLDSPHVPNPSSSASLPSFGSSFPPPRANASEQHAASSGFSPSSVLPPRPRSRHDSISASSASIGNPSSPTSPLSSPSSRSFSIDQNPPGNTIFVGNLPASASAGPTAAHLEEQLRNAFTPRPGFRQISFRVKTNGPMCFVEFEDVHRAAQALADLNGDTLGGAVKNGGLRLSFSKNPLFRSTIPGPGGVSATSAPGSQGERSPVLTSPSLGPARLSLAQASETLVSRSEHQRDAAHLLTYRQLSTSRTSQLDFDSLNNLEET